MTDLEPNGGEEIELDTVTLTLEDDSELECAILAIYPVGALMPLLDDGELDEEADVLLYRYVDNGPDAEPDLENIEDDDEYEMAADAFDELLDEEEFDEK